MSLFHSMKKISRGLAQCSLALLLLAATAFAQAQTPSRNLAPGFTTLPKDAKVVVAPLDLGV